MRPTLPCRLAPAILALATATPAAAHPHVFVDATIEVVFDAEGRAEGLRIGWTYDDLISLTILSERGMDEDFDGVLTPEELTAINGFDMGWEPGFAGDTYPLQGGKALGLSGPSDWTVSYDDARLRSTHFRRFDLPVDLLAGPLVVQSYDPGHYTAYTVADGSVTGRDDCTVELFEPDRAAADARLEAALEEFAGGDGAEADFPAIGDAYAEEVRVTCGAD